MDLISETKLKSIIMTFQCTVIENEKCCRKYGAVLFKYSNYDLTT